MRTTTRTGRAGRLGRRIRDLCYVLSALLSALLLRLQSGGYWGEEKTPSDRALRCPGGSGQGVCI